MLLSVCERLDTWDVVADMLEGVDVERQPAWGEVCEATADTLAESPLHRRLYYVAAALDTRSSRTAWRDLIKGAAEDVAAGFGLSPLPVSPRRRSTPAAARPARSRCASAPSVGLTRVTAGEIRWLYARTLRRGSDEPVRDEGWEPPEPADVRRGKVSVLAPLTDAIVKEGGYRDDPDRPRHRRYVRVDAGGTTPTRRAWRWPTCRTSSRSRAGAGSGCSTSTTWASPSTGACGSGRSPTPSRSSRCGASTASSSARSTSTTAR